MPSKSATHTVRVRMDQLARESLTPQLPAERISELRFAMVALAVPDLNSVVVEWANRRPALLQT